MAVENWVKELTESVIGGPPVEIGKRYHHPEHGVITITSGQYWGTYGLSNFWHWTDTQGQQHSGYAENWPEAD